VAPCGTQAWLYKLAIHSAIRFAVVIPDGVDIVTADAVVDRSRLPSRLGLEAYVLIP